MAIRPLDGTDLLPARARRARPSCCRMTRDRDPRGWQWSVVEWPYPLLVKSPTTLVEL